MNVLKRTPLFDTYQSLGARLTAFGGWEMPVQYSGITAEHRAVRSDVGLFDISHMGKYRLSGPGLLEKLQLLVPSDLGKLSPGQAQYTVLLNPTGGIIDDVIFYCQAADRWLVVVNGATNDKDWAWLNAHLEDVQCEDLSASHTLLALQGPRALPLLQTLADGDLAALPRFGHAQVRLDDHPAWLARTGYTGEDGFEIMSEAGTGLALWQRLLACGATPCGLGARDTLRLEAAMHLYGQDMDESTSPIEASLGWLIAWDKPAFIGKAALESQKKTGTARRLVGFEVQSRDIARHGYQIWQDDQPVGVVTSGTYAPTLARPLGLAYVPPSLAALGSTFSIDIRGRRVGAVVVRRPFYRRTQ